MKILEKYKEKVKIINNNNEIEFITIEEYNNIIKKHNDKITKAKQFAYQKKRLYELKLQYKIKKLKENGQWDNMWNEFKDVVEGGE